MHHAERRLEQINHTTLRHHRIIIQLLLHAFPQVQRMRIKLRIARQKIIGAHNCGIATDIATAQIALFEHSNIGHAMLFGEVKRGRQPMTTTTNNDDIILIFRIRIAPLRGPALLAKQPFFQNPKARESHRPILHCTNQRLGGCTPDEKPHTTKNGAERSAPRQSKNVMRAKRAPLD